MINFLADQVPVLHGLFAEKRDHVVHGRGQALAGQFGVCLADINAKPRAALLPQGVAVRQIVGGNLLV